MTLDQETVDFLAAQLELAEHQKKPITKITDRYPNLDWDDAYAIQTALRFRKSESGVKIAGLKAGLTSKAKMKQMKVEEPVFGFLCDYGAYTTGSVIPLKNYIAPRVEAEIAFITGSEIAGPIQDIEEVLPSLKFMTPGIEILDSRYQNFQFDLVSVVADNTSAAGFVVGDCLLAPTALDLVGLKVVVEKNGRVIEEGTGAAVLGHPVESVVMLANNLGRRGEVIPAETFIMTGGITAATAVEKGDNICAVFEDIGSLSVKFE